MALSRASGFCIFAFCGETVPETCFVCLKYHNIKGRIATATLRIHVNARQYSQNPCKIFQFCDINAWLCELFLCECILFYSRPR